MTTVLRHQNARDHFRPTDTTLILDVSVQSVQGRGRSQIVRQTKQAPVRGINGQSYSKSSVTIGPNGHEVKDIDGMIVIEASFPFVVMIGGAAIECTGIFSFTGSLASLILVAAQPTAVTITAVLRNL